MTLHIINNIEGLEIGLQHACDNDALLLIEDGVRSLLLQSLLSQQQDICNRGLHLYALKEDIQQRDLSINSDKFVSVIDVHEFVKLCESHRLTVSW